MKARLVVTLPPRAQRFARAWLCLSLVVLWGCAGHSAHTLDARRALDRHDARKALELYNKELKVEKGSQLPQKTGGDNAVFLLDRSMISQQLEHFKDSSQDLETADKQVEMLDFTRSSAHEIGRYLFSDDVGPYKARPFEKLLINTMNMVNYLARGELQGAKVEARRLVVMQKYLQQVEDDPSATLLGPGSYLAGFIFEMAREFDEALHYYDEALRFTTYASLEDPVRRVAQYSSYRSPRITPILAEGKGSEPPAGTGEVLVVVGYGRVPALKAERLPIGLALTYAGLYLDPVQNDSARRLAGQGLVTWVNYPTLETKTSREYQAPIVHLDQQPMAVDTTTNVEGLVRAAFEKAKGPIIASALVRLIARGAAGAGVGVGVAKSSDSPILGMLAALGTQAALSAVDTPDTRSWATLPARIAIARMRVPAGRHTVRVAAQGVVKESAVDVPDGGFAFVNLTELSQN